MSSKTQTPEVQVEGNENSGKLLRQRRQILQNISRDDGFKLSDLDVAAAEHNKQGFWGRLWTAMFGNRFVGGYAKKFSRTVEDRKKEIRDTADYLEQEKFEAERLLNEKKLELHRVWIKNLPLPLRPLAWAWYLPMKWLPTKIDNAGSRVAEGENTFHTKLAGGTRDVVTHPLRSTGRVVTSPYYFLTGKKRHKEPETSHMDPVKSIGAPAQPDESEGPATIKLADAKKDKKGKNNAAAARKAA